MSLMQSMRNFLWAQEDAQGEERYVMIAKASFKQALSHVYTPPSETQADNPSPERLLNQPVILLKFTFIELVKEFTKPTYALNVEERRIIAALCDYFDFDPAQLHASTEGENDAETYLQNIVDRINAAEDAWDFLPTVETVLQQVEAIPPQFWNRGLLYRTFITVFSFPVFDPANVRDHVVEQYRNQLARLERQIRIQDQKIAALQNRIGTLEREKSTQAADLDEKNREIEACKHLLANEKATSARLKKSLRKQSKNRNGSSSDSEEEDNQNNATNEKAHTPNAQKIAYAPSKNSQRLFSPTHNDAQCNEEIACMAFSQDGSGPINEKGADKGKGDIDEVRQCSASL